MSENIVLLNKKQSVLHHLHDENHATRLYVKWVRCHVVLASEASCVDLRKNNLIFCPQINVVVLDFLEWADSCTAISLNGNN